MSEKMLVIGLLNFSGAMVACMICNHEVWLD